MKTYNIIQLGVGNIGSEVIKQISGQQEYLKTRYDIHLNYYGAFSSRGGSIKSSGFTQEDMWNLSSQRNIDIVSGAQHISDPLSYLKFRPDDFFQNLILVDTTSAENFYDLYMHVLERGGKVVMANKKLLTATMEEYKKLNSFAPNSLLHETTVGAGLPIIKTLKTLLATGDEITSIDGCFSGTLGYLCSELEERKSFSETVKKAKELGYTEPDPRDDLSGMDVARKALILARMLGEELELEDVTVRALFPDEMKEGTVDQFMNAISQLNQEYAQNFARAKEHQKTYRYMASISHAHCAVEIREVEKDSPIGMLSGPDNIVVFRTKRYDNQPLVIKGPGAGREVTAAGVFGDILTAVGVL